MYNPLEFLRVAESLAENNPSEADLRSAISRTYYAVFHVARLSLQVPGRRNIHNRVIRELMEYNSQAGSRLRVLRDLRNVADYRLAVEPALANWRQNYQDARQASTFVLERLT